MDYSIVDEKVSVGNGAVIGENNAGERKIAVLGRDISVADGAKVAAGKIVDENVERSKV